MNSSFSKHKEVFLLVVILAVGAFFRLYGLNWDQGHHLHPDERAIVMFTLPLHFPQSIDEFLSPTSPLNPHFFAYGNFPLYLLKGTAVILSIFDKSFDSYDKINLIGRAISSITDIGTIVLLYFIGKKIFNKKVGFLASFFYAVSVFPIQTSHFYAVDTLLTFFITRTLYQLICLYEKPSIKNSVLSGVFFGLSLATKVSAIPLVIAIVLTIALDFILLVIKQPHKPHIWFPHVPSFLKRFIFDGIAITISTVIIFIVLQPYSIIDFPTFWRQNIEQAQMTRDAFTFPYTLQYVGKIPYLYELKNVFFWGQGPILATLSFVGTLYISFRLIKRHLGRWRKHQAFDSSLRRHSLWRRTAEVNVCLRGVHSARLAAKRATSKVQIAQELIIATFFFAYFFVVGKFAVGWMRYMLPLYPLLALFAAVFLHCLLSFRAKPRSAGRSRGISYNHLLGIRSLHALRLVGMTIVIILIVLWPLFFMHIYTKPNTRVLASQWIYQNIPADKTIAREHWDDGLPIGGNISYQTLELPIYEMENLLRETQIYQMVQQSDYIIIASNRLYVPLQRLSKNCQKWNLPQERCSKNANRYYKKLFNGELGYEKVAEFSVFPQLSIFNPFDKLRAGFQLSIDDSSADESFTVYDHPKVMIFKKILF